MILRLVLRLHGFSLHAAVLPESPQNAIDLP